jgi:hypothetical protein
MVDKKGNLVITWCVEDVQEVAKQRYEKCTKARGLRVLELMDKNHDCNYGITWDTIYFTLDEVA